LLIAKEKPGKVGARRTYGLGGHEFTTGGGPHKKTLQRGCLSESPQFSAFTVKNGYLGCPKQFGARSALIVEPWDHEFN
jgi:hypothetical protein